MGPTAAAPRPDNAALAMDRLRLGWCGLLLECSRGTHLSRATAIDDQDRRRPLPMDRRWRNASAAATLSMPGCLSCRGTTAAGSLLFLRDRHIRRAASAVTHLARPLPRTGFFVAHPFSGTRCPCPRPADARRACVPSAALSTPTPSSRDRRRRWHRCRGRRWSADVPAPGPSGRPGRNRQPCGS